MKPFLFAFLIYTSLIHESDSGAVQLDNNNIDQILADNEFVFINFYADWCRFSNMLAPIWDEGADKISSEMAGKSVVVGKVDCDKESNLVTRFHITKYPTIKFEVINSVKFGSHIGARFVHVHCT